MSKANRQRDIILHHLREYGSITAQEAQREYGVARLASRINDLRKAGVPVKTETEYARNRYGELVHYARYELGGV